MKIVTNYIYPPIPVRQFDWTAVEDGYEPGCPIGYGSTETAAKQDLLTQLVEDAGLSDAEQKQQGMRCGCHGSDDYCVCQNTPDNETIAARIMGLSDEELKDLAWQPLPQPPKDTGHE